VLSGCYTLMVRADMHINHIVVIFGLFVVISMSLINRLYRKQIVARHSH
jgi:MFS transporter, LPLT family, lysophospholipid transporter